MVTTHVDSREKESVDWPSSTCGETNGRAWSIYTTDKAGTIGHVAKVTMGTDAERKHRDGACSVGHLGLRPDDCIMCKTVMRVNGDACLLPK
jgi:hypothetical protein